MFLGRRERRVGVERVEGVERLRDMLRCRSRDRSLAVYGRGGVCVAVAELHGRALFVVGIGIPSPGILQENIISSPPMPSIHSSLPCAP
jgi:hypothetical protein